MLWRKFSCDECRRLVIGVRFNDEEARKEGMNYGDTKGVCPWIERGNNSPYLFGHLDQSFVIHNKCRRSCFTLKIDMLQVQIMFIIAFSLITEDDHKIKAPSTFNTVREMLDEGFVVQYGDVYGDHFRHKIWNSIVYDTRDEMY